VERAAGSMWTPLGGGAMLGASVAGAPPEAERGVIGNFVTPGWFAAYGTPIRTGRDFDRRDSPTSPPVAIVNEAFVRRFTLGNHALGTVVRLSSGRDGGQQRTIVGVAANAVFRSGRMIPGVASLALRDEVPPMLYVPLAQSVGMEPPDSTSVNLSVRAARGSPGSLAPALAASLTALDPGLTFTFRPLGDYVDAGIAEERTVALLAGFFGATGLLLAGVGIYGVTTYSVSMRRREIGIRMTLGAAPRRIILLVFRRVALLIGTGAAAGALVSLWGSRALATLLYGVEARDPSTFAAAVVALAAVGALAGVVPALRASRTDPVVVLRAE
jgi:hypothetical protein